MNHFESELSMRLFLVSMLVVCLAGCGSEAKLKSAPVQVSGNVSQSGKPVGSVLMVFHPLGDGHVRELPVNKTGTFSGELVSGDYAYYVAKPATRNAAQTTKIAPKYFEADMSRVVSVEAGKQLAINLD